MQGALKGNNSILECVGTLFSETTEITRSVFRERQLRFTNTALDNKGSASA